MPCYTSHPGAGDHYIESPEGGNICKVNETIENVIWRRYMIQTAMKFLDEEKIYCINIPHPFKVFDTNDSLCSICSHLTKEQLASITSLGYHGDKTLLDWYEKHCKEDEEYNKWLKENVND